VMLNKPRMGHPSSPQLIREHRDVFLST